MQKIHNFEDITPADLLPGQSDITLRFHTLGEMQTVIGSMLAGASHEVAYLNPRLDEAHLGTPDCIRGIESLMLENRAASMRLLVDSSQALVASGHRLVESLRRFMPQVACRVRRAGSRDGPEAFLVVDRVAYLLLPDPDFHGGTAGFNAAGTAEKLLDVFDQAWEVAQPDPEMQPLNI
jgi:hypothetical protein